MPIQLNNTSRRTIAYPQRLRPRSKSEPTISSIWATPKTSSQARPNLNPLAPAFTSRPRAPNQTRALIAAARKAVRHGQLDTANMFLDVGIEKDVNALSLWNEKLSTNKNRFDIVQATLKSMERIGIRPNEITFRTLSWACDLAGDSPSGWAAFYAMRLAGFSGDARTLSNFVNLFERNYQPHYVWEVFKTMHHAGVGTYQSYRDAIKSLVSLRVPDHAHEGLLMMRSAGFLPDVELFNQTLDLYRIVQKPEQVWILFNLMGVSGVAHDMQTVAVVERAFDEWGQRLQQRLSEFSS